MPDNSDGGFKNGSIKKAWSSLRFTDIARDNAALVHQRQQRDEMLTRSWTTDRQTIESWFRGVERARATVFIFWVSNGQV